MALNVDAAFLTNISKINRNIPGSQPFVFILEYPVFLTKNSMDDNLSNRVLFALMFQTYKLLKGKMIVEKTAVTDPHITLKKGTADVVVALNAFNADDAADYKEPFTYESVTKFVSIMEAAEKQAFELILAAQTGGISEKNVESYYKMAKCEIPVTKITRFINFAADVVAPLSAPAEIVDYISKNTWLQYHTAYCSTPALAQKFIDECQTLVVFSEATRTAVLNAKKAAFSKTATDAIPPSIIKHTAIYLKAAGTYPDGWYQGNKALASTATFEMAKLTAVYRKFIDLSSGVTAVNNVGSLNDLKVAMGNLTL